MKLNYEELAEHFAIHNFKWKIGGELVIPDSTDLEKVVREAYAEMQNEPDFATLKMGRLHIERAGEVVGIYAYFGDESRR